MASNCHSTDDLHDDLPDAIRGSSRATQRVYDALRDADDPLGRLDIQGETRHAASTVREALAELRRAGLVERRGSWPVPRYALSSDD